MTPAKPLRKIEDVDMAPPSDDPQDPKVIQWRLDRMDRDVAGLLESVKTLTELVRAQEVRRQAEYERSVAERAENKADRDKSSLSLQQWGVVLTVLTIAFTLAGGVIAPALQAMILGD